MDDGINGIALRRDVVLGKKAGGGWGLEGGVAEMGAGVVPEDEVNQAIAEGALAVEEDDGVVGGRRARLVGGRRHDVSLQ